MRSLRLLLAGLVATAGLVLLGPSPAQACSCAGLGLREHVEGSDAVLGATVTDVDDDGFLSFPARERTYELDVDTVWVGEPAAQVSSEASGASCGLEGIVEGKRYVFFASESPGGMRALLCGGTGPATPRLVARVEAAAGPGSPAPERTTGLGAEAEMSPASWAVTGGAAVAVLAVAGWRVRRRRTS